MGSNTSKRVRLQILLRPACRNHQDRTETIAALKKLGIEVTGSGAASISARASGDVVADVFGTQPLPGRRSQPEVTGGELAVPDVLAERVESVSIAPQHISMSDDDGKESQ